MKYINILLVTLSLFSTFSHANTQIIRKKITGANLNLQHGQTEEVVSLNFCSGSAQGAGSIIWDDYFYNQLKANVCANSTADCTNLENLWNQKNNEDDEFWPSYLLAFSPSEVTTATENAKRKQANGESLTHFEQNLLPQISQAKSRALLQKAKKQPLTYFQQTLINNKINKEDKLLTGRPSVSSLEITNSQQINDYDGSQMMITVSGMGIMSVCGGRVHPLE